MKTFFTFSPPKGGQRIPDGWGALSCCLRKIFPLFLLITLYSLPGFSQMMSLKNADMPIVLNVADYYIDSQKPVVLEDQQYVVESGIVYNESTYRLNISNINTFADPVPAPTPCQAHRWFAGDGWRFTNGAWTPTVLPAPNLQPKGIVRCASSAETESQLQTSKGTYVVADNPIAGVLPETDCFSMTTETFGNALSAPTDGEEIVWLNFDIRPLAGTYQFQIVTNGDVGWVLFHVDPDFAQPTGGNTANGKYPLPDPDSYNGYGVSGNCEELEFATIDIGGISHPACGFSGNGWTTITVPSFKKPTNYYLAMWMASPSVTEFPSSMNLVYKSRYGCGGATCTLEFQDKEVVCNNNGTYTVCSNYGGSAGKWFITDETGDATSVSYTTYKQDGTTVVSTGSNPPTNPLAMELGIIPDGAVFATVCATYPLGTAYDIKLTPDPLFKPSNDYVACADGDRQTGPSASTATVTASANPTTIDIASAAHNTTLSVTGVSPGVIADYTYLWSKPANASGNLTNANTATATYTADVADAGQTLVFTVVATPTDPAVCPSSTTVTVNVGSVGQCEVTGPSPVCQGSINTYTGSPTIGDPLLSFLWTVSGDASIVGANDGQTVDVLAGSTNYTVTVEQTYANTALNATCGLPVTVTPRPSCIITGPDAVCAGSTGHTYTSAVTPSDGTITHSWSISAGGSIVGATDGASITVTAGAAGTYTVTDNISRNGCTSTCTKTTTVNVTPSCIITGPDAVCAGSTGNTYTSAVTPSDGTITHSWSISAGGSIVGATDGASVTVTAGAAGSYTVTDNISRNGCTSTCTKTTTVNVIPSCIITGPDAVCGGSTGNTYTSAVTPSDGTITHSWSVTAGGSIVGPTDGASVSVTAGASGSYTITDNISRNGCTSSCQKTVTISAPTCTIAGPDPVCVGSVGNVYTSTVSPAGGTVTHSWSISGNGTINGSTTGASISVDAGAAGSYTVTDIISRDGCTSTCSKTITVNNCGKACTPGFWKTHPEVWDDQGDYLVDNMPGTLPSTPGGTFITTTSFYAYFNMAPTPSISNNDNLTMLDAAGLGGGNCKALARHGVSALLGAAAFPDEYPFPGGTTDFTSLYNLIRTTLISGDCSGLATILADINNLDGPFCGALSNLPPASIARVFTKVPVADDKPLSLSTYPNPYNNVVNFKFASPKSGKAMLEVYDIMGRRMAIVYQGQVSADVPISTRYYVPALSRVALFYRLTVDGKTIHGSVLPEK